MVRQLEKEIVQHQTNNMVKCKELIQQALLEEKKDPDKADQILEKSLMLDPTNVQAMLSRGYIIVRNQLASKYMKAKEM